MRGTVCPATFRVEGVTGEAAAEVLVLDENQSLQATTGAFADTFQPYDVHLYKIAR